MQTILIVALVLAGFLVAGQAVAFWLLLRGQLRLASSNGEIVQYLENVETLLSGVSRALSQAPPAGTPALPIGTPAPTFALPDLSGRERRLDEFLGKPLILTFFSTTCGFCAEMAPRLGQLEAGAPRFLLVSRGGVDDHLKMAAENKWQCDVLLEPGNDVISAYKTSGTPTGYLIDADGRIASDLAVGADALFALMDGSGSSGDGGDLTADGLRKKEAAAAKKARDAGLAVRPSTLQRDGLPAGTPAPDFVLPDLDGEQHRLEDFRSKRVLLVFSDPNCGPCDALTSDLVRLQQAHSTNNLQIVMISRGDPIENEEKAKKHGVTFPVLLQNRWDVSREYAMFATPVGYLIDEKGVIAKDVAIGKSAILSLV
jgi:peroxiredoxin